MRKKNKKTETPSPDKNLKKAAKADKKAAKAERKKEKSTVDMRRITLITGIHDSAIDYGSYLGAVIEIPPVELRFFSDHRRT